MENNRIVTSVLSFFDRHQWQSFVLAMGIIILTGIVALKFGHGMSSLLGVILY